MQQLHPGWGPVVPYPPLQRDKSHTVLSCRSQSRLSPKAQTQRGLFFCWHQPGSQPEAGVGQQRALCSCTQQGRGWMLSPSPPLQTGADGDGIQHCSSARSPIPATNGSRAAMCRACIAVPSPVPPHGCSCKMQPGGGSSPGGSPPATATTLSLLH